LKVLKFIGWLFIPFIMIFLQWNRIGKLARFAGISWACLVIIIGISSQGGTAKQQTTGAEQQTPGAASSLNTTETAEASNKDATSSDSSASATTTPEPSPEKPKEKTYTNGQYLVGKDIESGLYKVKLTDDIMKMGYVERSKDTDMQLDSIIANIILTGDGYVEIKDTDVAVKLTGVELTKIDKSKLSVDLKSEVSDGIYLVDYDVKPGRYKVEVTDTVTNMGYVERAKNVSMGMDDIIANEVLQGPGYVTIKPTDFAIRVQGAKLTFQQ
jgi:hypothetical protein